MKKQTLHQLNRIVYIDAKFNPSTTYEFAPALISPNTNVYIYSMPLASVLHNLGFEWFYVYNYARYDGTGGTTNYAVYSASVGGLLVDNTEIFFEPNSVETVGILPSSTFSSLGITNIEFSNDGGTSWTAETVQNLVIGLRVIDNVQYLTIRISNGTGLSNVNKVRFTFSAPANRVYFALYNECKEG